MRKTLFNAYVKKDGAITLSLVQLGAPNQRSAALATGRPIRANPSFES